MSIDSVAGKIVMSEIDRLVFTVSGVDAGKYLHSQLSNDIASLPIGESRMSFLLEPMGKVVALLRVTRHGDQTYVLDTDVVADSSHGVFADQVLSRLNRFKIRVQAEITMSIETYLSIRSLDGSTVQLDSTQMAQLAQWGDGSAVDIASSAISERELKQWTAVDPMVIDELRIRTGWPLMGREIMSGETVPAACGVIGVAVSFTKGCYPGQELVERMDSRGSSAPKNLRFLTGDIVKNAVAGASVILNGETVGEFTSVTSDCALAYVSRSIECGVVIDKKVS